MNGWGRRKKILIDRLQVKLLTINIVYLCCIIFVFLVAIFSPVIVALLSKTSFERSLAASTEFLSLHRRIWPAVPVALVLISIHSILVSHRVAGPLYRFRKVFDRVEHGDLSVRAGVRRKDYLGREAETINRMIDGLVARIRSIERRAEETRAAYWEIERAVRSSRPDEAHLVARMDDRLGRLEQSIQEFQLPDVPPGSAEVLVERGGQRPTITIESSSDTS